jgi:hypothetical protein
MQECNFALVVTSRKRLGKTHLHVENSQNVKCGYFWTNWISETSGNPTLLNFYYWGLLKSWYLLFCPSYSHPRQKRANLSTSRCFEPSLMCAACQEVADATGVGGGTTADILVSNSTYREHISWDFFKRLYSTIMLYTAEYKGSWR